MFRAIRACRTVSWPEILAAISGQLSLSGTRGRGVSAGVAGRGGVAGSRGGAWPKATDPNSRVAAAMKRKRRTGFRLMETSWEGGLLASSRRNTI
ncbi:MAG: hypothetical protein BWY88_00998 [Synergistetes bacterium ADurb.Bin520]|nr:MAG: hypothetical protein BWY88_00998 [Synergistetes bacterium ADurb.Bin520]